MNTETLINARREKLCLNVLATLSAICTEPLSLTRLSIRIGVSTGAMTGIADQLEKRGFATRIQIPTDRRRYLLHPTCKGLQLIISTP